MTQEQRETLAKDVTETVEQTVNELRAASDGLGGLAFFAERLEKQMEELRTAFS